MKILTKLTTIDYEQMVQESLRNVIKETLSLVAKNGLPGSHHLYLSFKTTYPGVDIPDYLRDDYPEEITIVLQYEFWDLEVSDDHFCITLCFNDIHERLTIPYTAIVSFVDPSVRFGLQFTPIEMDDLTIQQMPLPVEKKKTSRKTEVSVAEDAGSNIVSLDHFRKK